MGLWVRNKEQWADREVTRQHLHVCVKELRVRSEVLRATACALYRNKRVIARLHVREFSS